MMGDLRLIVSGMAQCTHGGRVSVDVRDRTAGLTLGDVGKDPGSCGARDENRRWPAP